MPSNFPWDSGSGVVPLIDPRRPPSPPWWGPPDQPGKPIGPIPGRPNYPPQIQAILDQCEGGTAKFIADLGTPYAPGKGGGGVWLVSCNNGTAGYCVTSNDGTTYCSRRGFWPPPKPPFPTPGMPPLPPGPPTEGPPVNDPGPPTTGPIKTVGGPPEELGGGLYNRPPIDVSTCPKAMGRIGRISLRIGVGIAESALFALANWYVENVFLGSLKFLCQQRKVNLQKSLGLAISAANRAAAYAFQAQVDLMVLRNADWITTECLLAINKAIALLQALISDARALSDHAGRHLDAVAGVDCGGPTILEGRAGSKNQEPLAWALIASDVIKDELNQLLRDIAAADAAVAAVDKACSCKPKNKKLVWTFTNLVVDNGGQTLSPISGSVILEPMWGGDSWGGYTEMVWGIPLRMGVSFKPGRLGAIFGANVYDSSASLVLFGPADLGNFALSADGRPTGTVRAAGSALGDPVPLIGSLDWWSIDASSITLG
jgi:hypothetical protein